MLVPSLIPIVVSVVAFINDSWLVGFVCIGLGISVAAAMNARRYEWRLRDGRSLNTTALGLRENHDEVWQRLASKDLAQYTPLDVKTGRGAWATLHTYWPDDEPVTYVVVTKGVNGPSSEILEFRNIEHVVFQAALVRGLQTPYDS